MAAATTAAATAATTTNNHIQSDVNYTNNSNRMKSAYIANGDVGVQQRPPQRKESQVSQQALLTWLIKQVEAYENVVISDMSASFQSGQALAAIIHR